MKLIWVVVRIVALVAACWYMWQNAEGTKELGFQLREAQAEMNRAWQALAESNSTLAQQYKTAIDNQNKLTHARNRKGFLGGLPCLPAAWLAQSLLLQFVVTPFRERRKRRRSVEVVA